MAQSITSERLDGGVTLVKLVRPEARNALTPAIVREFTSLLDRIDADHACRVVVLAADGPTFCAGLDLKQSVLGPEAPRNTIEWMALQDTFARAVARCRSLRQPIVAAVQGAAVGAGFGLALASDVRIVGPAAQFLVGAVKIGLSAGECGISYHLPRLIGAGRAFEIMLTGRAVSAEEAVSIGLASRLAAEGRVLEEALATARAVAANSPYSIKHTKQVMWTNLEAPSLGAALELENHVQVAALSTEDFREGVKAFAEKRPPDFKGV